MQASSDTKTETAMVWHCARVYHNRFLCRTYQHSSEPLGNAATWYPDQSPVWVTSS